MNDITEGIEELYLWCDKNDIGWRWQEVSGSNGYYREELCLFILYPDLEYFFERFQHFTLTEDSISWVELTHYGIYVEVTRSFDFEKDELELFFKRGGHNDWIANP